MAKGNPFMGTLRGKVGDNIMYVSGGQQNVIKYQSRISNPRSAGQMYQRARFSNAGRFFTRGRQALFKFAFEGKKPGVSDFNAFMQANINRSVLISKSALAVEGYPAIGDFIMSKGSLPSLPCRVVNDYWQVAFGIEASSPYPTTVGALSKLLIESGSFEYDDILTFVWICTFTSGTLPSVKPSFDSTTDWTIKQFRVNPNDLTPLSDYEMRAGSRSWSGRNLLTLIDLQDSQLLSSDDSGFVCIHSRNTRSGLKVSTQVLALGSGIVDALQICRSDSYIASVIEDWQATQQVDIAPAALLKGSLSWVRQSGANVDYTDVIISPSINSGEVSGEAATAIYFNFLEYPIIKPLDRVTLSLLVESRVSESSTDITSTTLNITAPPFYSTDDEVYFNEENVNVNSNLSINFKEGHYLAVSDNDIFKIAGFRFDFNQTISPLPGNAPVVSCKVESMAITHADSSITVCNISYQD